MSKIKLYICHLMMMAMTNVIEAMVFTTEVTNVGDVYFKLAKYMFRVKLTLHFRRLMC